MGEPTLDDFGRADSVIAALRQLVGVQRDVETGRISPTFAAEVLQRVADVLDQLRLGEIGPVAAKRRLEGINDQVTAILDRAGESS